MTDDDLPVIQLDFLGKVEEAEEGFGVHAEFNDDWEESTDFEMTVFDECGSSIVVTELEVEKKFAIDVGAVEFEGEIDVESIMNQARREAQCDGEAERSGRSAGGVASTGSAATEGDVDAAVNVLSLYNNNSCNFGDMRCWDAARQCRYILTQPVDTGEELNSMVHMNCVGNDCQLELYGVGLWSFVF